jgi:predicted  nucleic acid-binding Zn ribbon protein
MYLTQIKFDKSKKRLDKDEIKNAVESYLAALARNGQLCGEYVLGWIKNCLFAYIYLARPDALEKKYHSKWGKKELRNLIKISGRKPNCTLLADDVPKHYESWKTAPSLCLFTACTIHHPPIVRTDYGTPIPAYLLPISDTGREEIGAWEYTYRNHDLIWMGCGHLEIPAYKELVDPTSELAMHGRKICKMIEKSTGIPTFYYLFRYWGRKNEESSRRCPCCGNKWLIKTKNEPQKSFWDFPYQCKKCRLVSDYACTEDDMRYAHIGEYKPKKQ